MTALQILLVEDQALYIKEYKDVLADYVEQRGRQIEMRVQQNLEDAKRSLDGSIDAAVVDLNLGKDTSDGGEVIKELKRHFRIPVAVLTGTPDDADDDPPVVRVFTKGEHGFEQVLDRLWEIYETGLTKILGGRGMLEERLNRVFLNNLVPTVDVWIGYGARDPGRTEKALLRYALGHLVADLEGDETPCFPEEFYLDPPLEEALTTGSLLERKRDGACHVVMTPACDLVVRNGKRKAGWIVVAEVVPEEAMYKFLEAKAGRKKQMKRNNDAMCHWLPEAGSLGGGFLDFGRVETILLSELGQNYSCLEARIAPSFVKDIVSRFSIFYARQGQPEIDEAATGR